VRARAQRVPDKDYLKMEISLCEIHKKKNRVTMTSRRLRIHAITHRLLFSLEREGGGG